MIPALLSLQDCADYTKTVQPFLPQLYALPQVLMNNGADLAGLKGIYIETNPLVTGFSVSVLLGAIFLAVSELNRNYSQVDRMWSILPNLYVIHFAVWARLAGFAHHRLDLVAIATTIWSARLTFNYWRKGGYNIGSEDYRWCIIMKQVPKPVFFLFNVTFISFIQSILLFAFSAAPAYGILLASRFEPEITAADWMYFYIELGLVLSEWISDGQQWDYQTAKHEYLKTAKVPKGWFQDELDRGFITSGLWAYSRHPNFFAEQAICWAGAGSLALFALFQGSTWLTELISAGKYPEYKDYQKQVGMFFPTSIKGYKPVPVKTPKVIRTSELAKRQEEKEQQKN
ncbi:hypothetical protein NQ176_g10432 [Zarea fungicola]|uniref:Uncharacterized protein n=1 Tax=Zarea fungicola TaxID=93591 RepID=A0ACC1MGB6_9HYPO|nr:hypothetical protein NQ176_g10432 [Lecanicillium fungicola]